jgi:hypothetical protein
VQLQGCSCRLVSGPAVSLMLLCKGSCWLAELCNTMKFLQYGGSCELDIAMFLVFISNHTNQACGDLVFLL